MVLRKKDAEKSGRKWGVYVMRRSVFSNHEPDVFSIEDFFKNNVELFHIRSVTLVEDL